MNDKLVSFKGNNEGIYVHIKEGDFKVIKNQLELKLRKIGNFFKGSNVINFKGKQLTIQEKDELKTLIEEEYGIAICEVEDNKISIDDSNENIVKNDLFQGIDEGQTKFIRSTIRSGQCIEYDGNLVIIGDVNPGGQLIASGNIIVMGSLRGFAHAGKDGKRNAIVVAYNLQPTQLRIGDIIARKPDDEDCKFEMSKWPEIARIEQDVVMIEPYLPKK